MAKVCGFNNWFCLVCNCNTLEIHGWLRLPAFIFYIHHMKIATICCLWASLLMLACAGPANEAPASKSGTVKMKDAEIYYESHGKGEPLLLLHAGFLNTGMWKSQVDELSKHYQVITIDLPAHGKTINRNPALYPSYFISTLLDSLQLNKVSIGGVSLGSVCAMDFVLARPDRVNKAIIVSGGIIGWEKYNAPDSMVMGFRNSFYDSLERKDTAGAAELFTKFWFDGPFRTPQQVNDSARRYIYESTLSNIKKHALTGYPRFQDTVAIDHLASIKVPVLLIDGDKDVPHILRATDYMQKTIPGARRVTIPGTGHMLNMEDPAAFNKAVLDFLNDKTSATIKK